MGVRMKFGVDEVMRKINGAETQAFGRVRQAVEDAADELAVTIELLTPFKSGALESAVYVEDRSGNNDVELRVLIDPNVRVPGAKNRRVGQYAGKIEAGDFNRLGKKSMAKEATIPQALLASRGVERSEFGTYVGSGYMWRAWEAIAPKWQGRIAKAFQSAINERARFGLYKPTKAKKNRKGKWR